MKKMNTTIKFIARILFWIIALCKFYFSNSNFWEIGMLLLLVEISFNINSFEKIIVSASGISVEKVKKEIYSKVIEDISQLLVYLLTKTGKLATRNRKDEILENRTKLIGILEESGANKYVIKDINNSLIKDVESNFHHEILSELNRLFYIVTGVHKSPAIEISSKIVSLLKEQKVDKILPIIKEQIELPNFEEETRPIKILIEDYKEFIKKELIS